MRSRLKEAGPGALADYELLELILFRAIPRRDVKPIAKSLIDRFGSFGEVIAADPGRLAEIDGMSAGAIAEFKIVEAAAQRCCQGRCTKKRLPAWLVERGNRLLPHVDGVLEGRESFRILFLDKKNGLIADEVQGVGHLSITPRSIRA